MDRPCVLDRPLGNFDKAKVTRKQNIPVKVMEQPIPRIKRKKRKMPSNSGPETVSG